MTTLSQTRDGLEARLNTIDGLRVYDYIPDDAHYPAAIIRLRAIDNYDESIGGGNMRATYSVILLIPATVDRQQLDLYPFVEPIGAQSIPALIKADHTLGGLDVDARVTGALEVESMQMGVTNLYGTSVNVLVFIS